VPDDRGRVGKHSGERREDLRIVRTVQECQPLDGGSASVGILRAQGVEQQRFDLAERGIW
jgi:hypothetical protein